MLTLAFDNAVDASVTNAEFLHGHIEDIPLPDDAVDVIISNCVLNLSTDKLRVLVGAFRVLRPRGQLCVSDIITEDKLDPEQRVDAEQRLGCSQGALTADEYRQLLAVSGFVEITITPTTDAGRGLQSAIVHASKASR